MKPIFNDLYGEYKILQKGFDWDNKGNITPYNEVSFGAAAEYDMVCMAHSYWYFIPFEKYGSSNPEFCAMVNGHRPDAVYGASFHHRKQVCTTNIKVIDMLADKIIQHFNNHPECASIVFGPNDGVGFCECGKCKELDEQGKYTVEDINNFRVLPGDNNFNSILSKRMLTFFCKVAELVAIKYPNKIIRTPIYSFYRVPPLTFSIKIPANLELMSCRSFCHSHAIDDERCNYNQNYIKELKEWKKLGARISIYEYYWKVSWLELPFPILRHIPRNHKTLRSLGVSGFKTQIGHNIGTLGATYYTALESCRNPEKSWQALLTEYCDKYFGTASAKAVEYYVLLEDAASNCNCHFSIPNSTYQAILEIFNDNLLDKLLKLSIKIENLTQGGIHEDFGKGVLVSTKWLQSIIKYLNSVKCGMSENIIQGNIAKLQGFIASQSVNGIIDTSQKEYYQILFDVEKVASRFNNYRIKEMV